MLRVDNFNTLKLHLAGFKTAFARVNKKFVADVEEHAFFMALFEKLDEGGLFFIEYDINYDPTFCAVYFPTGKEKLFLTLMYMREQDKYRLKNKLKETLQIAKGEGYKHIEYESPKLGSAFERLMKRLGFEKKKVVYERSVE